MSPFCSLEMADQVMAKGAQDARRDWEQQRGCFMNLGDLHSNRPLLNDDGFYIRLSWDEGYVADYNTEMNRLISEFGVPWWAPGNRIPSKELVRELLLDSVSYEAYQPSSKKEENLIRSRESNWVSEHQCKPSAVLRDSDHKVVLIGGGTPGGYRVDIVDLVFNSWMHTYEAGEIGEL